MNDEEKSIEKHIFISILIFNLICEIVSIFVIGFSKSFLTGILIGTVTMIINYILLGVVIDCILCRHKTLIKVYAGMLIYGIRLIIFTVTAYLCVKSGIEGIIAYAISVISLVLFASILYVKEEKK